MPSQCFQVCQKKRGSSQRSFKFFFLRGSSTADWSEMVSVTEEPAHKALSIAIIAVAYGISLPITCFCLYQLYKNWHRCYIAKRYPWILAAIIVINALMALFEMPADALARLTNMPWSGKDFLYVEMFGWECRFIICTLVSMRAYLLH